MTATFPDDFNLADYFLFDRLRDGLGDKVALRFGERAWTYAGVAERSRALARALVDSGLQPEQRVYIALPDTPAFAWSIFATLAAGGVVAMGNPHAPFDDLMYVMDYIRAAVVITTPAVAEALAPRRHELPHLRDVLVAPDAPTGDDPEAIVSVEAARPLAHAIASAGLPARAATPEALRSAIASAGLPARAATPEALRSAIESAGLPARAATPEALRSAIASAGLPARAATPEALCSAIASAGLPARAATPEALCSAIASAGLPARAATPEALCSAIASAGLPARAATPEALCSAIESAGLPARAATPEALCSAIERGRGLAIALPRTRRDDPAIWLFTSGSTGRPKAAMHSHRDFAFNTEVYAKQTVGYRQDDIAVSVPRLFFGYATGTNLWFPFAVGATVGLFSERPTAESVAAAIARYRPTIVTNVPTMLGKLLDLDDERRARGEPGLDLSCVRFHLSAGEALPEPLLRRFTARFGAGGANAVYDGIGSAEMFHIYCSNRPGDIKPGSLGRVVDGYRLAILPEEADAPGGAELPPGEIGVLWVRGDSVAHGYFQDRDKSWKTFHGHWCRTGDLFAIDADGYLWFSGRADDLFKVGGVFVAPREVEDCLLAHPAVSVAAVIPAEDDGLTKPKAVVVLRPEYRDRDRARLADELKAHVQARLSKHKYPRWIAFVDDLPKNNNGKVDKKLLIERERRGEL